MNNTTTILVVEDDEQIRSALKDKLVSEGYAVVVAHDGEEGLALAEKEKPALILLDLMMPKMGGLEMGSKLRATPWGANLPVLILTNVDDVESVEKAMESGMYDYLVKSNTPVEHVVDKVRSMLEA